MAPSRSAEGPLCAGDAELLLDLADDAILDGLLGRPATVPSEQLLPAALRVRTGLFVTLTVAGDLNGCIGSIDGELSLAHAAVRHAWSAAFADPRLEALTPRDYRELTIEVSVLSPLVTMPASTRLQVIEGLRPGVDGLVIAEGRRRAVFLPSVWEQLPEPATFLRHLQAKARMSPGSWSDTMQAWRFSATKYARQAGGQPRPSEAA